VEELAAIGISVSFFMIAERFERNIAEKIPV
jgi:hypothetical protein